MLRPGRLGSILREEPSMINLSCRGRMPCESAKMTAGLVRIVSNRIENPAPKEWFGAVAIAHQCQHQAKTSAILSSNSTT